MNFKELSSYLTRLEETLSRNEMTQILSDLFKCADGTEIDKIVYLVLGQLAPNYTGLVLNIAEKMMLRVIAKAYKLDIKIVEKTYKEKGDLGNVTYSLAKVKGTNPSVTDVFNSLLEVAKDTGTGSQERKVAKMSLLLSKLDPLSAKYVSRIPVGKLRLGFSDMTILDALSLMERGDKSGRKEIEAAFNVSVDIGKIAKLVKEKGIKGVGNIEPTPGTPIRPSLCERLPSAEKILEKVGKKVFVEPKYDGIRCIGGFTPIYTKNKGYISIKSVRAGDYVLTHKGRYKKVLAVNKRVKDKKEAIYKLQTYLGNSFKISEGHNILVFRNGETIWLPIEGITKKDWVCFPKPKLKSIHNNLFPKSFLKLTDTSGYSKTINTDLDFYKFLGFWIGDGYTNNFHNTERIGMAFNAITEKALIKKYKDIVKRMIGIEKISENIHNGSLYLYWRDKPLREWLTRYFRREWKGKMLPDWFININKKTFLSFLEGWIDSDGTNRHGGGYRITTKERDLASFVQILGLYHGVLIGVRRVINKISSVGFRGTYYEIIIPGSERKAKVVGNKILVKILNIEKIKRPDPRLTLYNLRVQDDESYCTGMVPLHNCQLHIWKEKNKKNILLFSRNLETTTAMFPDLVEAAKKIKVESGIFDGEAIAYDSKNNKFLPFQETIQRKRKHGIDEAAKNVPLRLFIFDVLSKNGKSFLSTPFNERRKELEKIDFGSDKIEITRQDVVDNPEVMRDFIKKYLSEGLEGAVIKKMDAPYKAGARGYHWVKYKKTTEKGVADTIDCLVMGTYGGKGKRTGFGVGAFLVGIKEGNKFKTVSKIGTGLSDEQWRELDRRTQKIKVKEEPKEYEVAKNLRPDTWVKPSLVVEILADEITKSPLHSATLALRFPRLIKFRDEKNPDQTTSYPELKKLFEMQKV